MIAAAEALAGSLPPLLVAARRVGATVAAGVHGRGRAGPGESFWQFRPLHPGEETRRIDWRRTARAGRAFVRDSEWEAAQTVLLWRAADAGMEWASPGIAVSKKARAELLLLALASLLLRGGERVGLLGGRRAVSGRNGLPKLEAELGEAARGEVPPVPDKAARQAALVLFGDFLAPPAEIERWARALAALPATGHLVQVLDPAEVELPFAGRVRFDPVGGGDEPVTLPRVEAVRAAYRARLAAQQEAVRGIVGRLGWTLLTHRTDRPPATALMALHQRLAGVG